MINLEFKKINTDEFRAKDYGFDSLYFRYAIAIDELARYKQKESSYRDMSSWGEAKKRRFWEILEDLLQVHGKEE